MRYRWLVCSQVNSESFQRVVELVSQRVGHTLMLTGTAYPGTGGHTRIRSGPKYWRRGLVSRAVSWLAFAGWAAIRTWRLNRTAFLLTTTNPPLMPWVCLLRSLWGGPYGVVVWDIYPDHLAAAGLLGRRNPLFLLWRAIDSSALRRATILLTPGQGMARELLSSRPGLDRKKLKTWENWAQTNTLRPVRREENWFAQRYVPAGCLAVMYSGNVGLNHGCSTIVEAATAVREDPRFVFLVVGDGLGLAPLKAEAKKRSLDNVTFLPYQSPEAFRMSLASAPVGIVTQRADIAHLSVPSKVYAHLAVGAAILACAPIDSDLGRLVRRHRVGRVVDPPGDATRFVKALLRLADDPAYLADCRRNARRLALRQYSEDAASRRLYGAISPFIR